VNDDSRRAKRGRTRAPWKLTAAERYDRYSESLLPMWAQVVIAGAIVAFAVLLLLLARNPAAPNDGVRLLALLFPVALAVGALLVRGGWTE
jgi:hypothetical protein